MILYIFSILLFIPEAKSWILYIVTVILYIVTVLQLILTTRLYIVNYLTINSKSTIIEL